MARTTTENGKPSRGQTRAALVDRAFYAIGLLENLVREVRGLREEWAEAPEPRRRHMEKFSMNAPVAGGDVEEEFYLPVGTAWMIRRVVTSFGTGGGFALYLDTNRPENAIHVQGVASADDLGAGIYVPEGERLVVRFFSQPAVAAPGQLCTANIRADELVEGE